MEKVQKITRLSKVFALIFSVLISVLPPAGYYFLGYENQKAVLETEAHMNSIILSQLISTTPEYWRYEQHRMEEILMAHTSGKYDEICSIIDVNNALIAKNAGKPHPPFITVSHGLFDSGTTVGRIEIQASLLPLFTDTVIISIFSIFFGAMIFVALRVFPLRALSIALQSLYDEKEMTREKEEKLLSITNTAQDAIVMIDDRGNISFWNPAAEKIFGYSSSEAMGQELHTLIVLKRYREAFKKGFKNFSETGQGAVIGKMLELKALRKGGEEFAIELSLSALQIKNKWHAVGVIRDITERKEAEEALRSLTLRYEAILAAVPDIIMEVDNSKVYTWANEAGHEFFGKDVIGKEAAYYFEGEQQTYNIVQPLFSGSRDIIYVESWQRRKDGEKRLLSWWCRVLKDPEGNVAGVLSTARDITEHKKTEEALKKSEEFNRNILESVDEGFIIIDRDYRILTANRAFADKVKLPVEKIIGEHCYEISHHRDVPCNEAGEICGVKQVFETGEHHTAVHTHYDSEDKPVFVETKSYTLSRDESGKVMTVIEILVDITEKRKLEEQLRHSQKMDAVGTLAGGIAHDFNNILNVIIGYGTMVMDKLEADSLLREQMNEVLTAADRAATLTRRLLVFSRKQVEDMRPVNVNDTILGMEKMISRIIGEDIAFAVELAGRKMIVMADIGQIEQVLMNLISNARDAMPKGGRVTISTGIREVDDEYIAVYGYGKIGTYAFISVTDTGSGMDAETRAKIFEPFFTTKGIGKGTGLGLAIVYGIIKQYDGYIEVYSEAGKGTTFKILLPIIEEKTEKWHEAEAAAPVKGGTETILAAEDDASLRNLLRIVLEAFGYTVITAEDGEDAITKYREHIDDIRLVILDMIMPKKNGKEAYAEIKNIRPDIKAVFISGYTMDIITKKELLDLGVDFIPKPVSPKDLLKKVREILDR